MEQASKETPVLVLTQETARALFVGVTAFMSEFMVQQAKEKHDMAALLDSIATRETTHRAGMMILMGLMGEGALDDSDEAEERAKQTIKRALDSMVPLAKICSEACGLGDITVVRRKEETNG